MTLLTLPLEVRLRIYDYLFTIHPNPIPVEAMHPDRLDDEVSWTMRPPTPSLSSQVLRICRQIHSESHHLLYQTNTFDVSQREGLQLLLKTITPANFSLLTSLILDWDQLTDLAWSLARPEFVTLTANLTELALATWRTRVLGGHSALWHDVKSYERQLCQSASEICAKSAQLNFVVQRPYFRPKRKGATAAVNESDGGAGGVGVLRGTHAGPATTYRIKWRFLTNEAQMRPEETRVDVDAELAVLRASSGDPNEERGSVGGLDPI